MPREDPKRILRTVGHNLTIFRQDRGWTQAQAADRLGLDVRSIQRIEAGGCNLTILTAARYAHVYGRTTRELFDAPIRKVRRQPGRPRKRWTAAVRAERLARERAQKKIRSLGLTLAEREGAIREVMAAVQARKETPATRRRMKRSDE